MLPTWSREFDSRYPLHYAFSLNCLKVLIQVSLTKTKSEYHFTYISRFNSAYFLLLEIKVNNSLKRICYDKNENYKIVSDDLYKNGIFTDDENDIATNILRKVKPKEQPTQTKKEK